MPPKRDRPPTHSYVIVPLICASLSIEHPGISALRIKYAGDVFDSAVEEISIVISKLPSIPRILRLGSTPYVSADEQNLIIDLIFDMFPDGYSQIIQTDVAMTEAAARPVFMSNTHTQPEVFIDQFSPISTLPARGKAMGRVSMTEADARPVFMSNTHTQPEVLIDQFSPISPVPAIRDDQFGEEAMLLSMCVNQSQHVVDQFGPHGGPLCSMATPFHHSPSFDMSASNMLQTALGQQFRSNIFADTTVQNSRAFILDTLGNMPTAVRKCPHCGIMIIGCHTRKPFAERDEWCCGRGFRQHLLWPPLPPDIVEDYDFSKYARVINSLLSVAVIHGPRKEGLSYRTLSYQAPVMTLNGQVYARLMRNANHCWFIHDADYDKTLLSLLKSADETSVLERFTRLLQQNNCLHRNYANSVSMDASSRVSVLLDEETRMCSVYVDDGNVTLPPARSMYVLGSAEVIDELDPAWEVLAYPTIHWTGDTTFAWSPDTVSAGGRRLTILDYARSVILMQPKFWKYGRLAEQWILDMWARNEQQNVRAWTSPQIQDKLRSQAEAHGRLHVAGKIYLPSSVPGCHAYQRRFFHDALHLSRVRGSSHLFVTVTCNPNWPEVRDLLGTEIFDLHHASHQAILARVFVYKRKQLLARLKEQDYLFPGHCGIDWIVYSTEWQKGDLPHAHIAVRLKIDTTRQSMNTQLEHLRLMDQVVSAQLPDPNAPHYHQVVAFMQHPSECKSCLREKPKGSGKKACRFYFPKPVCPESRIDSRGFPVYRRTDLDVRVVPHNWKLLVEFNCHINSEWTFHSKHLAYVYGYMCKGVDVAGVRIQDEINEIASFRRVRILTVAEACYRILGFNINLREPAVVVCPIYLPRKNTTSGDNDQFGHVVDGVDEFGDRETHPVGGQFEERPRRHTQVSFKLDYLDHYFNTPDRDDSMKFADYYATYYATGVSVAGLACMDDWVGTQWIRRKYPIEARITWYPPYAGEIYFLRILLHHISPRNWGELYGGFPSFKQHCIHLGIVDTGEEYLYAMNDAIEGNQSPAACRHLFALIVSSQDTLYLDNIWSDVPIRRHLAIDFWPSDARGETFSMDHDTADMLALMDIAVMVQGMGGMDYSYLMKSKGLPPTLTTAEMPLFQASTSPEHFPIFKRYASIVGYSVTTQRSSPQLEREITRFRETTKILTSVELRADVDRLNTDQKAAFDIIMHHFVNRHQINSPRLFNVNASAGCGKTFLMNRVLNATRCGGAITASVCSIGIGALQFDDGRTVHSFFSVPIQEETDVLSGMKLISKIIQQLQNGPTARSEFLRALDLLVWDEIGAIKKDVFNCVDHLFRVVMGNDLPFGGKFVVTLGDWRQIPPVDECEGVRFWDGDPVAFASIFNISVKSTELYERFFEKLTLTINERAKTDSVFHASTCLVGDGILGPDIPIENLIAVGVRVFYTVEASCHWLFETDIPVQYHPVTVAQRAILSPYNADVDGINEYCEGEFVRFHGGHIHNLLSVDEFVGGEVNQEHLDDVPINMDRGDERDRIRMAEIRNLAMDRDAIPTQPQSDEYDPATGFNFDVGNAIETVHLGSDAFSSENLNDLSFKGVPPHRLKLFVGAVVVLLRNLDAANRLQNGVRLIIKDFVQRKNNRHPRVVVVTKAEDEKEWKLGQPEVKTFLLYRIKFMCKMGVGQDAVICRRQFPIRMCNAVSIHKSQSMTLDRSVIDARSGVFEHGQFFVAYSRCRRGKDTALLLRVGQTTVRNIVLQKFVDS